MPEVGCKFPIYFVLFRLHNSNDDIFHMFLVYQHIDLQSYKLYNEFFFVIKTRFFRFKKTYKVSLLLTLRRPLRKKLRMRWFFDASEVKESIFF